MMDVRFVLTIALLVCVLSCRQSETLFTDMSPTHTGIDFINHPDARDGLNILSYLYYYNGGGVAIGDINNDSLPDIYFTANSAGANRLYLNKGSFRFEDITQHAGVSGQADWYTGVTMADVNGDGLLDIYVCVVSKHGGLTGKNELFINNGDHTFTESASQYGLDFSGYSTQAAFFDFDHDGDLDCYLLNQSLKGNTDIIDTLNRNKTDQFAGDKLYRNDLNTASGRFIDITDQSGIYSSALGYGLGLAVADLNNDGWDDIYVGNDFNENDYYYINNGNGTFTESGEKHFGHYSYFSMGNDIADFNNDGQPDIITLDMLPRDEQVLKTYGSDLDPHIYNYKLISNGYQNQFSKNCLQLNNNHGTSFSDISLLSGVSSTDWSWAALFADFDNDGNKDLFVSSGIPERPVDLDFVQFQSNPYLLSSANRSHKLDDKGRIKMPEGSSHPYLFAGDGRYRFTDMSLEWGTGKMKGYYNGAAYADLDNDGKLDLVINSLGSPAVVLRNNSPDKKFLSISLHGEAPNTKGVGAKVYVYESGRLQYQQLMPTRGFQSSSDVKLHFGLHATDHVDSIRVIWPDQRSQTVSNLPANQHLILYQKDAMTGNFPVQSPQHESVVFDNLSDSVALSWTHEENDFADFNVQYLIPHGQSTRGPKMAVGDVNNDGIDDFFIGGAKGQAGALMLQDKDGKFWSRDTLVFAADAGCEDVDAVFFDANSDGHLDLFVVSGGNEYTGASVFLVDRLYLNDGSGKFRKATNALPLLYANKSCVSIADVDKDGDEDLFVGVLADAASFGSPQTAYLLLNDGTGNFQLAPDGVIDLLNIGMVTSSGFSDLNKDGWMDLVVAGEWMPVTIFDNIKGRFVKRQIAGSGGLWQTISIDDVNGDGFADIIGGNWGYNSKFSDGKDGPLQLYTGDFDKNGTTDHLLSYVVNETEFPFLAKDAVERQLPLLKKHYLLYSDYANVPMNRLFYGWIDDVQPLKSEQLGSAVWYGDEKGKFTMEALPTSLQLAPIFSVFPLDGTSTSDRTWLIGGNFFNVIPFEGRYDAQALRLFNVEKREKSLSGERTSFIDMNGEVRDIKTLNSPRFGKLIIVARNNDTPQFLRVRSQNAP